MNRWKLFAAGVAFGVACVGCGTAGHLRPATRPSSRPTAHSQAAGSSASPVKGSGLVGKVLAQVRVGAYPDGILAAFGSLWTANLYSGSVSRIDPAVRQATATISVPKGPISLLAADGAIWVADYDAAAVTRIDPATNRVNDRIRVGPKPVSLLVAHGKLWVFNQGDDTASVIDPRTVRVVRTLRIRVAAGFASVHGGLLWVPDFQGGSRKVIAVDPATGRTIRAAEVGSMPVQVGFGLGSGWTGNGPDDTVTRFNPQTGAVQHTIRTPADAGGLLVAGSAVWIASYLADTLTRINPETNSVIGTLALSSEPNDIAALDGYLWVTESGGNEVAVIRPG